MKPEDDPEARIRELEQPLADTARPLHPPPLPYLGSLAGPPPQGVSRNRTRWIVAAVFGIGIIALSAGIVLFAAQHVSHTRGTAVVPTPRGGVETRTSTAAAPSAPTTSTSVSGINESRTVVCDQNTVSVSGVSNSVVITGHCARLSVSGVQNNVTVEAVDTIEISGFDNQIIYRTGSPHIDQSGQGNVVHRG